MALGLSPIGADPISTLPAAFITIGHVRFIGRAILRPVMASDIVSILANLRGFVIAAEIDLITLT